MRWWAALLVSASAGCYSPHPAPGSPCDPGVCPAGLVCDPLTHTCQEHAGEVVDSSPADAGAGWLAGYSHRKALTISSPSPTALAGFPVSLVIAADADLAQFAHGGDIVATGGDGTTLLPFELVAFDAGSGALEAWFAIDVMPAPAATPAYLYFDGPAQPPATTSPWTGYAGVWHLAGANPATDSARGHDGSSPVAGQAPAAGAGVAGGALVFDGLDDTILVPDPADGSLDFGVASFSYSLWVLVAASAGMFDSPLYKGGASIPDVGYDYELGTGSWTTHTSDGTVTNNPPFGLDADFLGAWTQLAVVVDRDAKKIRTYANGALASEKDFTSGSLDNARALAFSRIPSDPFKGSLDEVQIIPAALATDWIAASYANITARPQFVALGQLETR
jgi:concanavalin A-like lectin/glucanase superfamily protein